MALGDRFRNMAAQGGAGSRFGSMVSQAGTAARGGDDLRVLQHNYAVTQENAQSWAQNMTAESLKFREKLELQRNDVDETGELPLGFSSREEYIQAYKKAKKELHVELQVSPVTVGRFFGQEAANKYRNISGYAPWQYGRGNRLDEYASTLTQDGSGYNIMVRGLGGDAEGALKDPQNVQLYTAPGTYSGRRVEDLAAEGGDEAVEAGTYKPMPLDTDTARFREYQVGLFQKGNLRRDLGYAKPGMPDFDRFDILSKERYQQEVDTLQTALDQGKLTLEEHQEALRAAEQAYAAVQRPAPGTTAGAVAGAAPTTADMAPGTELGGFLDTEAQAAEQAAAAKVKKPSPAAPLTPGEGIKNDAGEFLTGEDLYNQIKSYEVQHGLSPNYGDYVAVPGQIPYAMTKDQWDSLTYEQRQDVKTQHLLDSEANLKRLYQSHTSGQPPYPTTIHSPSVATTSVTLDPGHREGPMKGVLKGELDKAKAGATSADDALIKEVEKFYSFKNERAGRTVGGGSKEEFLKVLAEDPEKLAEFRESPFAFAEKYKDGGLYPDPIPPEEKAAAAVPPRSNLKGNSAVSAVVDLSSAGPITTLEDLETLRNKVNELETLDVKNQQAMVDFIEKREGRLEALDKYERAWMGMNIVAASAQDSELFKTVAKTIPLFIETGKYHTFADEMKAELARIEQNKRQLDIMERNADLRESEYGMKVQSESRAAYAAETQRAAAVTSRLQANTTARKFRYEQLKDQQIRVDEYRNLSERGKQFVTAIDGTAVAEKLGKGEWDDIQTEDWNEYLHRASSERASLAAAKRAGAWGNRQEADAEVVTRAINMALKVMLPKFAAQNLNMWQDFLDLLGADYTEDFQAFELEVPLMAIGKDGKPIVFTPGVTPNANDVAAFAVVDANGNRTNALISAAQVHGVFGPDVGMRALIELAALNQLRR